MSSMTESFSMPVKISNKDFSGRGFDDKSDSVSETQPIKARGIIAHRNIPVLLIAIQLHIFCNTLNLPPVDCSCLVWYFDKQASAKLDYATIFLNLSDRYPSIHQSACKHMIFVDKEAPVNKKNITQKTFKPLSKTKKDPSKINRSLKRLKCHCVYRGINLPDPDMEEWITGFPR